MIPSKLRGCAAAHVTKKAAQQFPTAAQQILTDSHSIFAYLRICSKELMTKRIANNKSGINVVTKKKCSLRFNPEWLVEVAETELPTCLENS